MGKNDEVLGRYFADNNRYADLINGFVLHGKQILRAEDLSEYSCAVKPLIRQTGNHLSGLTETTYASLLA